jgi:hypothetical protein
MYPAFRPVTPRRSRQALPGFLGLIRRRMRTACVEIVVIPRTVMLAVPIGEHDKLLEKTHVDYQETR